MQSQQVNLEQTEAWDDYAIQSSWNAAVAEYEKYHSIAQSGKPLEEFLTKKELQAILEAGKRKVARPFRVGDKTNEFPPLDPVIEKQNETIGEDERDIEEGEYEEGEGEEVEYEASAIGDKDDEFEEVTEIKSSQAHRDASNVNDKEFNASEYATASASHYASPTQDEVIENAMQSQYWAGYYRGYYDAMKKLNGGNEG